MKTLDPPTLDRAAEISIPTLVLVAERDLIPCREIARIHGGTQQNYDQRFNTLRLKLKKRFGKEI